MRKKLLIGAMVAAVGATSMPTFAQDYFAVQEKALKAADIRQGAVIAFKGISNTNSKWVNFSTTATAGPSFNGIFIVELGTAENSIILKRKSDNQYIGRSENTIEFVTSSTDATQFTVSTPPLDGNAVTGINDVVFPTWATNEDGYQIRFTTSDNNYLNIQRDPVTGNETDVTPKYATGKGSWSIMMAYDASNLDVNYPTLKYSEAPSNGVFAEKTYWYNLTLRNKYASYVEGQDYISLTDANPNSYGSFWAFVKTSTGAIEVYNAATGATKVLASEAPKTGGENQNGGTTYPTMVDKDNLGDKTKTWFIKLGNDLFYLKREGETENYYLNERGGKLAFWTNGSSASDAGSQFRVLPTNIASLIESTRTKQAATTGAVGALTPESYANFTASLGKGNGEGLAEALKIRDLTGEKVIFDPSKYYRIKNLTRKYQTRNTEHLYDGGYLEVVDRLETPIFEEAKGYRTNACNNSRALAIWKFESNNQDGQYYLKNLNAGTYMSGNDGVYFGNGINTSEGATAFTLHNIGFAQHLIKKAGTNQRLHASGAYEQNGAAVMLHNGGDLNSASAWYIIEANTISLTIGETGYATVHYPFAVQLPEDENINAYTGTVTSNGTVLQLTEVPDRMIPANTPVVLVGESKDYELNINYAGESTPAITPNALNGTLLYKTIDASTTVYGLGLGAENHTIGFYKMKDGEGANRTIGANKAYLPETASTMGVKGLTFSFSDENGQTTGIEDTVINPTEEEYYDLQGRRVLNPTKGIYVTKSGKKVFFTK